MDRLGERFPLVSAERPTIWESYYNTCIKQVYHQALATELPSKMHLFIIEEDESLNTWRKVVDPAPPSLKSTFITQPTLSA